MDFGYSREFNEDAELYGSAYAFSLRDVVAYFQPIYNEEFGLKGFEALVRLKQGSHIVGPAYFLERVPEQERGSLDLHMLKKACAFLHCAEALHGSAAQKLFVGVNITPEFLAEDHAAQRILSTMRHYEIVPAQVKIELIERPFLNSITEIEPELMLLKKHGVNIVLDDYTTGASTPERLTQLWEYVCGVKLPREFLLSSERARRHVAQTIPYDVEVTLEGTETSAHMREAREFAMPLLQGYGFNRPLNTTTALSIIGAPLAMDLASREPMPVGSQHFPKIQF